MTPEEADRFERLEKEIAALREQLKAAENTVRRAKDPNPVQRPSLKRVFKLVHDACMTLTRKANGWLLKLGNKERVFKRLTQIWELLLTDDWSLGDIFPPKEEDRSWRDAEGRLPKPVLRFPQRYECLAPNYHPRPEILIPF